MTPLSRFQHGSIGNSPAGPSCALSTAHARSFTLIEMLIVVAIMVIMLSVAVMAISGIKGAGAISKAAADIQGNLEQARAYAMANNTYVFVGFQEVDVTRDASVVPQTAGTGRIAMGIACTKDGTSTFQNYGATNLTAISKLKIFDNLHLADLTRQNSGNMTRTLPSGTTYNIATYTSGSQYQFYWPVGSSAGKSQYTFQQIIQFDPQGVASFTPTQNNTSQNPIVPLMEIGLQQVHGASTQTNMNFAAIQIEGITGATHVYRP